ncbi:MAG TPA: hypothetical protein VNU95_07150 [Candidatus Acidoferrales bacterium]|jgi:hypothetical protein|nr:hypothetical protein [Candidatus Acidoferrales bacterium]
MGIRINAYAVDLPKFDAFLNTSLADLLLQYQRNGIDGDTKFQFSIGNAPEHFCAIPGGVIYAFMGEGAARHREEFTEDKLRVIEILQQPARKHLSSENIYQALCLLRAFGNCKGIDFIKQLIDGHRRHWIGSMLQSAQPILTLSEFKELEFLFVRILRDINCGFKMSIGDAGFVRDGLPFVPEDDPDKRFGRWSEKECSSAILLLSKIMAASPRFERPPEFSALADDGDWHDWTRDNILSLLKICDLDYSDCNMLSFIG